MNKKIIKEKSMILFREIIEYHSNNRPPFSYEIYSPAEKNLIIVYVNCTFYRNYTLFENIFKYNINIYFHSNDFKNIPAVSFPLCNSKPLNSELIVEDPKNLAIINSKYFIENEEKKKKKNKALMEVNSKSEIQLQEEIALEKLKVFVNSFYKSKETAEAEKIIQENLRVGKIVEMEVNETKAVLDTKIPEIMKETMDRIDLANKEIIIHTNKQMSAITDPKAKK
jgi:hypothetical protein